MPTQQQSENGISHKKPIWFLEWYILAVALVALLMLFFASDANGATKKIDDLGLDLIDRVRVLWRETKCDEWPDKDGEYKCSGTFYVHPQGIRANKK